MSRLAWLLTALATLLVVVLWWFLLWSPTSEDIDQVRADTEVARNETAQQRAEEARLRQVRESSPEAEAQLAASRVIVPMDAALPALLRQLQQASDDAGARLLTVAPSRPTPLPDTPGGLASVPLSISVEGTYFQLVDLARRLEDPQLIGRGLVWRSAGFSVGEYPTISASLAAEVFTRVGDGLPPEPETPEATEGEATEGETDVTEPVDPDDAEQEVQ